MPFLEHLYQVDILNHFFPISWIKFWIEYFRLIFEWIFDWMNISNLVLNWILNWIIFGPDSMFDWIIETYRPGLSTEDFYLYLVIAYSCLHFIACPNHCFIIFIILGKLTAGLYLIWWQLGHNCHNKHRPHHHSLLNESREEKIYLKSWKYF